MKHIYSLAAALFTSIVAIAQPTINSGNLPQLGDHVTIGICSDIPSPSILDAQTGANYTWDFSTLTEQEEQFFDFVEPSNTYWPTTYQNSNICGVSWEDGYSFYNITPSALTTEGNKLILSPGDTASIIYTDQEQIIPIPYSMGTTFTDNFSGSGYVGGFNVSITGTIDFEADGYGTLILPNATYQNVVRYRFDRTQTNTISGFPPSQQSKTQWAWVSADHRFWLLLIEDIDDGFSTSYLTWFDKAPQDVLTSVGGPGPSNGPHVYPNPITMGESLQLGRSLTANETLQLFDLQGRLVKSLNTINSSVELDQVIVGVYLLKVINIDGQTISTQKLIVQ